ncbi:hypothetical protein A2U01_0085093, partial [Trifolium medium]|nr:hypothetical protein [Trifolium medium]
NLFADMVSLESYHKKKKALQRSFSSDSKEKPGKTSGVVVAEVVTKIGAEKVSNVGPVDVVGVKVELAGSLKVGYVETVEIDNE